jgi:serine/threonine-protein kinase
MESGVERLKEIDRVFASALDAAPGERMALLARMRDNDPELAGEVSGLLRLAEQPDSRLTPERVLGGPFWIDWIDGDGVAAGERIGAWRVLRELGRGGMATVFLAERADGAFRHLVALKLLRSVGGGAGGEEAVRRFSQERQILATLNHPSIARLLDGGIDEKGRPYIVMEHVEGMPIDRFCEERRLSVEQRLELFKVVARALLFAHRHLIIHRDLKPSNIFVTGGGEVKLLDFGIAKLLEPEIAGQDAAPRTRTVMRLMTPEYASPEQVRGDPATTASDVYQLGLLLYELLTGTRAYRLERATLGEAEKVICTEVPKRPSTVVAAPLARRLRGDLDDIIEKALRKEPERRYPSPEQMIEDLERHRAGRPVTASRGTHAYRARKFVTRHRLSLTMALLLASLLIGSALTATIQARRIAREAAATKRVKEILVSVFAAANPGNTKGEALAAEKMLDRGLAQIDAELAGEPEIQAELMSALGDAYNSRGLYGEAIPLLERSLAIRRSLPREDPLAIAKTARSLARNLHFMGRYDDAEPYLREALAIRRRHLGEDSLLISENLTDLGSLLQSKGNAAAAVPLLRRALAIQTRLTRPDDPGLGTPMRILGQALEDLGDHAAAEQLYRRSIAVLRQGLGPEDPVVAMGQDSLGRLLATQGDLAEADELLTANLALRRRLYGATHPTISVSLLNLGDLRQRQGRHGEARGLFGQASAMARDLLGADHPLTRDIRARLEALERAGP